MNYTKRIEALRAHLQQIDVDTAVISSYENRRYFCGFSGSNGYLIVTAKQLVFITDRRYTTQAAQETVGIEDLALIEHGADRFALITQYVQSFKTKKLLLESSMSVGDFNLLSKKLGSIRYIWEEEWFLKLRMKKDRDEIDLIRSAIRIAESGFEKLLPKLSIGMTEKEIADELHYLLAKEGAEKMSFDTIVASGPRGALAHGYPTSRTVQDGEMLVIDFGIVKDGYCSDMTRTLLFGNVDKDKKNIFDLVNESLQAAVAKVKPGVFAMDVEEAHRELFRSAGLEDYALKGLGHGIGLEIHEWPRVVINSETILEEGMIFTIEPGLYFPQRFGVRTEDNVLVTADGVENLTRTPHEIHIT